jgi:hypothetical protein
MDRVVRAVGLSRDEDVAKPCRVILKEARKRRKEARSKNSGKLGRPWLEG